MFFYGPSSSGRIVFGSEQCPGNFYGGPLPTFFFLPPQPGKTRSPSLSRFSRVSAVHHSCSPTRVFRCLSPLYVALKLPLTSFSYSGSVSLVVTLSSAGIFFYPFLFALTERRSGPLLAQAITFHFFSLALTVET